MDFKTGLVSFFALTLVFATTAIGAPWPLEHESHVHHHPDYPTHAGGHAHGHSPELDEAEIAPPMAPGGKKGKKGKKGKGEDEGEGDADDAEWDVNEPSFGPSKTITIDTDEGTWMNLDVSPDGQTIVFDMLGDLFTLPIGGGDATVLRSGLAWDMQPRFSPDGNWIAFTSDAGGGDNIWIMRADGSDAKAVTEESFRLLNNPAWSPDGEYIAARKHFTARRSLGAGEIWLYHRSGGGGLQLTEKPNDQKDVGEPAFSPDGRYIYYSQDTTSGDTFQYSKDPTPGIYGIQRFDRVTGETELWVNEMGGSVRPTPSPDGRHLAYVGRHRYKTALWVHDLETGAKRMLTDQLDRDLQETWAVHGVYANFDWTPNGDSIVYWAGGGLHRIDVESKAVSPIPFQVSVEHTVVDAQRVDFDPAPETFHTRMLRWVEVSPSGGQVMYQALGTIWLRDLPDGTPQRLTTQNDHFETHPSFSRDGNHIVYVSWDDEDLSTVRIAPVPTASARPGSSGRAVTTAPGHYVEPVLSPDGQTVVYRKISGGFLSSTLHGRGTGLYRIPAAGGEAEHLRGGGFRAHFGDSSDRVFFTRRAAGDKRILMSMQLDGTAKDGDAAREHARSDAATEYRVSPDGKWLAFAERFHAYVAAMPSIGKAIDVGPKTSSLPVTKVSRDAGEYLHWSGDSSALHWSLGPTLYSRALTDSFDFLDGAPETLPEPVAKGTDIGFDVDFARPAGTLALVGARIVTMDGDVGEETVIEDGTIVVEGDRIVAVGPRAEVEVPAGARTIDASDHTIMPGIVDVHWHGSQGFSEIVPEQNWFNLATLAFGVTTIHDPSTDTSTFFAASELARTGAIVAPRLFSTGTILYGAGGDFKAVVESLDDAREHLRRMKAAGAISVKSYNQPRRDQRQQILKAARELDMLVVPEGGSLYQHNMTMVADGHTGIEHAIPLANLYDDVTQLWSATEVGYTPTLNVAYGGWWGENYWYQTTDVFRDERLLTFVPEEFVAPRSRRREMIPEEELNHINIAAEAKQLFDAGVTTTIGAHGQREGLGSHWEMWTYAQGGMSPMEVIRTATVNGARYIGMEDHIGSLEVGKLADLVVLEKNPLDDIRNTTSVVYTMIGGRLYDAWTMNQVAPEETPRLPMFWEE